MGLPREETERDNLKQQIKQTNKTVGEYARFIIEKRYRNRPIIHINGNRFDNQPENVPIINIGDK